MFTGSHVPLIPAIIFATSAAGLYNRALLETHDTHLNTHDRSARRSHTRDGEVQRTTTAIGVERDGTREGSHVVGAIGNMLSCFHGTLRVGR